MTRDRVRRNTADHINKAIDQETRRRLDELHKQGPAAISHRIEELEQEWDMERVLETNASALALLGIGLSVTIDRRWLLFSGGILAFLLQHSVQGWCPPVPVFRRLGVRTRREIDREKYALKGLRGDFASISQDLDPRSNAVRATWEAMRKS